MGADRFVYWQDGKRPTHQEIRHVVEDYLGEMAVEYEEEPEMVRRLPHPIFVTLVGKHSHPLKRVREAMAIPGVVMDQEPGWEGRYLEVWIHQDSVNIETRMQDEITMRIADGLAQVFARFWGGKLEQG